VLAAAGRLAGAAGSRAARCAGLRLRISGDTRGAIELDETIVLVQKPFSRNDLARKVRDVLDRVD